MSETVTDDRGHYQVNFSLKSPVKQPDLQARVYANETFLAASDIRYNAMADEVLNVLLPISVTQALTAEYETLTSTIAKYYRGQLRDLKETADQSDVTYLANKTGWDARAVALAALADQFSQRTQSKVPAVYFYALFRAGLPATEEVLYHADADTLTAIWNKAAEQGVIPQSATSAIPQITKEFQTVSAQKLLSGPALTGTSSLKDMLGVAGLNDTQQQQFAELYAAHRTDLSTFWKVVTDKFGAGTANRLQILGKLAYLTINNAPLMQALEKLGDPLQLVQAGYHRPTKWADLLKANISVPPQILGDTAEAKQANYASYLAAQLRLSYPTAAIAELVRSGDLPVEVPDEVSSFLTAHQGSFEIGVQPVQQYIARNKLTVDAEVVAQVKRLQRVHQITNTDQAMGVLLKQKLDAAYHIVQHDRQTFAETFGEPLGGAATALQTYDRSVQVHGAVLNVAVSYLTARNGLQLGASALQAQAAGTSDGGQVLQPAPSGPTADNAADVIAYPTLESLFGSMDFCTCEQCRSILSPAAYLVDLLMFIDKAADGRENAQTILLGRRPDIQYLPLTCENTNTAMPYIDLVNEALEYYVANTVQRLSLKEFHGHDTGGTASEDLLANPQFVMDSAYAILKGEWFPCPLPFHQRLERLRAYFNKFDVPLPLAMERFRQADDLERGGNNTYGWRDVLMEELSLSRQEYRLLTDSTLTLKQIYGFPVGKPDSDVSDILSNAKLFCRRLGISYDEMVAVLRTQFINPNINLIPKLERLGVTFAAMQALHDGGLADADFLKLLPTGAGAPDRAEYDGDIVAWIKSAENYPRIMGIITLADPTNSAGDCNFDKLELRYSKPVAGSADKTTRLGTAEFIRLLRFIRIWKKMGWTIEQTDAAICSLYRTDLAPITPSDIDTAAKLDSGFLSLLPRLGVVKRVIEALGLAPDRDLASLLANWSNIGTHGGRALYREMFLNPALLNQDPVFSDNGYGEFLIDPAIKLLDHAEALRGAFNLTGDEFDSIVKDDLRYNANTSLNLSNISAIYRRGFLSRKLRLSVRELLLLTSLTGMDPFAAPDIGPIPSPEPPIIRFIAFVQALKARSIKSAVALYLIWNRDLSGKSAPDPAKVTELARTLRGDFNGIEDQFAATEDPNGDILRARMTLVYGQDAANAFFALLDNTLLVDTPYTHTTAALEPAIVAVDPKLAYDGFRDRLSHTGIMTAATRDALKIVQGVSAAFRTAVEDLFNQSQDALGSFFARHPELKPLYDSYVASPDSPDKKRTKLLADFKPELSRTRKRQQALQRLSVAAGLDLDAARTLLDPALLPSATYPLHAARRADQPALNDVLALERPGLAAQFFFRDTATGTVDRAVDAAGALDYSVAGGNPLPSSPTPGAVISGIWNGSIEIPEAGYYNIVIRADKGSNVTLSLGGQVQPLTQNGTVWRNTNPLQLNGGTLYEIIVTAEKVRDVLSLSWETPMQPRQVIPGRYLYPVSVLPPFGDAFLRLLKTASLATGLGLTANEIAFFATAADYQIGGDGWLNLLPTTGDPAGPIAAALLKPFWALLDFARIKADWSPGDERVLTVLKDPAAATADPDSLLFKLSRWDKISLTDVLTHFASNIPDPAHLTHFALFRRVYDAFGPIRVIGIPASKLIAATTNEPDSGIVLDFQAALRARFDAASWRDLIRPVNDALRSLQRDALVAYILHQMRENPATAHIDTPDKLFEYFLMDVEMDPCMQTSRIRYALSSVQLFIERCLMNLEPCVSPRSIDAAHWKWMKRLRLWTANRNVFLFAENWLEPELRSDKSPFFKEIESELLQSDITDDSAAAALLNYLAKLHDVAKLEPCGMYLAEGSGGAEDQVVHVVARSSGAHRHYYYRRYEFGYWTPWEQINLDIEDNPVIPVVWNNRLLLFSLRILQKGPDTAQKLTGGPKLTELTIDKLPGDPQVTVQAVLCWSEYYNGKWQAAKTSDINAPLDLGDYPVGAFHRSDVSLFSVETPDGLVIDISYLGKGGAFLLYNTHSLPLPWFLVPANLDRWRQFGSSDTFKISYGQILREPISRDVLSEQIPTKTVQPNHHVSDIWQAPFFFEDRRNVFYVTTEEKQVTIPDSLDFGISVQPDIVTVTQIPPLIVQPHPMPGPSPGRSIGPSPGVTDPAPMKRFITEDTYIHWGLGTTAKVAFGDRQIGPAGAVSNMHTDIRDG